MSPDPLQDPRSTELLFSWRKYAGLCVILAGALLLTAGPLVSQEEAPAPDNRSLSVARKILNTARYQSSLRPPPNPVLDYDRMDEAVEVSNSQEPPPLPPSPNKPLDYARMRRTVEDLQALRRASRGGNPPLDYGRLRSEVVRRQTLQEVSPNQPLNYKHLKNSLERWKARNQEYRIGQ